MASFLVTGILIACYVPVRTGAQFVQHVDPGTYVGQYVDDNQFLDRANKWSPPVFTIAQIKLLLNNTIIPNEIKKYNDAHSDGAIDPYNIKAEDEGEMIALEAEAKSTDMVRIRALFDSILSALILKFSLGRFVDSLSQVELASAFSKKNIIFLFSILGFIFAYFVVYGLELLRVK